MVSASRSKAKASKPRNTGIATVQMEVSNNFSVEHHERGLDECFFFIKTITKHWIDFLKGDDINLIKSR